MSVFRDGLKRGSEMLKNVIAGRELEEARSREQEIREDRHRLRDALEETRLKQRRLRGRLEQSREHAQRQEDQIERLRQRLRASEGDAYVTESPTEGLEDEEVQHRRAIGGRWEEMGEKQLAFLREHGLKPEHRLLDVGCGALRGGVRFIPYLDAGNYCGVDKNQRLLDAGKTELEQANLQDKRPTLALMDDFGFERLGRGFDYALAQSVFSHLPLNVITRCLVNVDRVLEPGGVFYATFFENREGKRYLDPLEQGDGFYSYYDVDPFHYTPDAFEWACEETALTAEYVGDWGHPRNQVMMAFRKKA